MFVSRLSGLYDWVVTLITGGWGDFVYRVVLFFLLFCFLSLRMPYIYGLKGFGLFLFFMVAPLFLSLFLCRLVDVGVSDFFSSLVPPSTPLWIAPFVCLAETLSYIVRPVVLLIRPFVNLSIGAMGGYVLGLMRFTSP